MLASESWPDRLLTLCLSNAVSSARQNAVWITNKHAHTHTNTLLMWKDQRWQPCLYYTKYLSDREVFSVRIRDDNHAYTKLNTCLTERNFNLTDGSDIADWARSACYSTSHLGCIRVTVVQKGVTKAVAKRLQVLCGEMGPASAT